MEAKRKKKFLIHQKRIDYYICNAPTLKNTENH